MNRDLIDTPVSMEVTHLKSRDTARRMAPGPSSPSSSRRARAVDGGGGDDADADAAWADDVLSRWFAAAAETRARSSKRARRERASTSDATPTTRGDDVEVVREEYRALCARFNARARVEGMTAADACALMYGVERARAAFDGSVIVDEDGAMASGSRDSGRHSASGGHGSVPRRRGGAWRLKWLKATVKDTRDALVAFQSTSLAVDEDMYAKACGSRSARVADDLTTESSAAATSSRNGKGCCPFCKMWFSRQHLPAHMRAKHTGAKPFVCERERCGEVFVDKKALNRHIALVHDHTFKCTVAECAQVFSTKQMLQRHAERAHGGARAVVFTCPHPACGKTYRHENSLVQHIRTHDEDGGFRFQCPHAECTRKFRVKADMLRHHRTHFGERAKAPRIADVNAFLTDAIQAGPVAFASQRSPGCYRDADVNGADETNNNNENDAPARMSRWFF